MLLSLNRVTSITSAQVISFLIVAYAFFLPISRAGIGITTALLFITWLIEGNFKAKFQMLKTSKVVISLIAFLLFSAISLLWSDNLSDGITYLKRYWYFLPILVFATSIKENILFRLVSAFLVGMMISEVLSYGIFFEFWTLSHGNPMDPTPFMNHLQYSMFLTFASLLIFNRFFFETELKMKVIYFIYFLTVTSNLFLNGGRTGHLAFAVSTFVVGFVNIKNKLVAFLTMLVLSSAIFYTAYQVSPVFKLRYDQAIEDKNSLTGEKANYGSSIGHRIGAWIVGLEMIKDDPILGTGIGSEVDKLKEKITKDMPDMKAVLTVFHFHNNYMTYAVQLGIIGLILYLLIFYYIYRLNIPNKELSNLRYIFITVFSVSSLVELMFNAQFPLALFALFVGIFISSSKKVENF